MAAALVGHGAFIKLGKEVTWGTGVSTTISNRINSITVQKSQERNQKANLSVPASGVLGGLYDGFINVEGTIDMPIHFQGQGLLFEMAFGGSVSVDSSGAPVYVSTFAPDIDLGSATLEVQRGSGISNQMEAFQGMKISTLSISCEAGGEMTASLDFIGKSSSARATNISSSFGTGASVLHFQAGQLSFNSVSYDVASMTYTINNNLERRDVLGSKETAEPTVGDVRTITMEVTLDVENNNLHTAYLDGTQSDVSLTFTSGSDSIEFVLTNALISEFSDPVNGFSRVQQTLTFTGLADSSNVGGKIVLTNGDSTGIAN